MFKKGIAYTKNPYQYKGINIMAAPGLHEFTFKYLKNKNKKSKILVLGSGPGAFEKRLIDAEFTNITSSDINKDLFVRKNNNHKFVVADLNKNFAKKFKEQFDLVIALEVVEHLYSPNHFLSEIKKLIKTSGQIIVSTPNLKSHQSKVSVVLFGYPPTFNEEIKKYGHVSPIYDNIFRFLIKNNNLKLVKRIAVGSYIDYFWWRPYYIMIPYFIIRTIISIVILPTTILNKKLSKGFCNLYIIKK